MMMAIVSFCVQVYTQCMQQHCIINSLILKLVHSLHVLLFTHRSNNFYCNDHFWYCWGNGWTDDSNRGVYFTEGHSGWTVERTAILSDVAVWNCMYVKLSHCFVLVCNYTLSNSYIFTKLLSNSMRSIIYSIYYTCEY